MPQEGDTYDKYTLHFGGLGTIRTDVPCTHYGCGHTIGRLIIESVYPKGGRIFMTISDWSSDPVPEVVRRLSALLEDGLKIVQDTHNKQEFATTFIPQKREDVVDAALMATERILVALGANAQCDSIRKNTYHFRKGVWLSESDYLRITRGAVSRVITELPDPF